MNHKWELNRIESQSIKSDVRTYICVRCGAGPLTVRVIDGKYGIRKAAKNLKINMDCNVQITKKIMEE